MLSFARRDGAAGVPQSPSAAKGGAVSPGSEQPLRSGAALGGRSLSPPVAPGGDAPLNFQLTSEAARLEESPGHVPSHSKMPARPHAKKGRISLNREPPLLR